MRIMDLLSLLLRSAAGCWLLTRIARPAEVTSGSPRPSCSVIIPARNEVRTLPTLLSSLEGQLRPGDEVLVVDDGSDDGTATLQCPPGARILSAAGLPDGWAGKCWACWTGSREARGELLLFLDADTEVEPGGLDRLIGAWAQRGGLVSVQPFHVVRRPYERLSAFFNVISMMGVDAFTPLGSDRPPRGAFGPAMVVDRQEYLGLGGHSAVRDELLDDVALARRWQAEGGSVSVLGGRGSIRFRMYPDGLGHLIEGWSKNLAGGAAGTRLTTLALIVAWVSLCIQASWWLLRLPFDPGADAADLRLGAVAYAAVALQLWWMLRRVGTFGVATAVLFPVPLAFFLGLFCRSATLTAVRGRVTWKGREISTRRRPAA